MKKLLTTSLLVTLVFFTAYAQLSGPLSGVIGPGTYHVISSIAVEYLDTLTIEPGTTFLFDGGYSFGIYGCLYALGSEEDSIKFKANPGSIPWDGFVFHPTASDSSLLEYCYISGSDAQGVEIYISSPTLRYCTITNNNCNSAG